MEIIAQHRRHHAGRAIGRRRDHPAAGSVFLLDRHGIDGEPVVGEQRIVAVVAPVLLQAVMKLARAAADIETAGQCAIARKAALDAAAHRAPDAIQPRIEIGARPVPLLVDALHFGNG